MVGLDAVIEAEDVILLEELPMDIETLRHTLYSKGFLYSVFTTALLDLNNKGLISLIFSNSNGKVKTTVISNGK